MDGLKANLISHLESNRFSYVFYRFFLGKAKILCFGIMLLFTSFFLYSRTAYVLADVMDDQLKSMWFTPFQAEEIDADLDLVWRI